MLLHIQPNLKLKCFHFTPFYNFWEEKGILKHLLSEITCITLILQIISKLNLCRFIFHLDCEDWSNFLYQLCSNFNKRLSEDINPHNLSTCLLHYGKYLRDWSMFSRPLFLSFNTLKWARWAQSRLLVDFVAKKAYQIKRSKCSDL